MCGCFTKDMCVFVNRLSLRASEGERHFVACNVSSNCVAFGTAAFNAFFVGTFPEFALDLKLASGSHLFRKRAPSATVHVCNPCCLVPQIFCAPHSPNKEILSASRERYAACTTTIGQGSIGQASTIGCGIAGISTCLTKTMRCFTNLQVRSHFRFCLLNILCEPTFFAINVVGCL